MHKPDNHRSWRRLVVPWMSFDGLLDTAFEQIRHYAVADIAVSSKVDARL